MHSLGLDLVVTVARKYEVMQQAAFGVQQAKAALDVVRKTEIQEREEA